MDLDSLKSTVSNLTLYDLKAGFRKAQNAVMNYTEMESKVREATNNEPWGASTTILTEIANATFNYSTLNEIMPMIYKRFTEKAAEEWRQIYKALQLLEYLIKNGSERVIDDARQHLSLLKMLRQFHFIDLNGKDQGINVRNRAKELADLLGDVEKIRSERKKARATKNKYGGVEGGAGLGSGPSSAGRYGGFGSEAPNFGGFSGGVYGDGGGFGGEEDNHDVSAESTQAHRDKFQEYDEYDEGASSAPTRRKPAAAPKPPAASTKRAPPKAAEPPKPKKKEPEIDLLGNDDFPAPTSTSAAPLADDFGAMQSSTAGGDDDDFDDFQSAAPTPSASSVFSPATTSTTTAATQYAAPQAMAASSVNNLYSAVSPPPQSGTPAAATNYAAFSTQPLRPATYQAAQPNYYTSVSNAGLTSPQPSSGMTSPLAAKPATAKPSSGGDPFASLMMGAGAKKSAGVGKGPALADMAKQKTNASLWGTSSSNGGPGGSGGGGASGDLLF